MGTRFSEESEKGHLLDIRILLQRLKRCLRAAHAEYDLRCQAELSIAAPLDHSAMCCDPLGRKPFLRLGYGQPAIGEVDDFKAFCEDLFSGEASLMEQDPVAVIESDMKSYSESGVKFAIGQVEVMTLSDIKDASAAYIKALEEVRDARGLDWAMLMVSDVIRGNSVLLETSYPKESSLPYDRIEKGVYDLPEVLSRKKQLLPAILRRRI